MPVARDRVLPDDLGRQTGDRHDAARAADRLAELMH